MGGTLKEGWGRGRGSGGYLPEHKVSKFQEAQRNGYFSVRWYQDF